MKSLINTALITEWWIVPATLESGITEYQISDGPPGERGLSYDFTDLEEGIKFITAMNPKTVFYYVC